MTLNQLQPGQKAKLQNLPTGLVKVQAIRLGLTPGTEVTCVCQINKGPVVISKNFQQIAIGQELAKQIEVETTVGKVHSDGKKPERWA